MSEDDFLLSQVGPAERGDGPSRGRRCDDETLERRERIGASENQECQAPSVRFFSRAPRRVSSDQLTARWRCLWKLTYPIGPGARAEAGAEATLWPAAPLLSSPD